MSKKIIKDPTPKTLTSSSLYKNKYLEVKVDTLTFGENTWEYAYFVKPQKNAVAIIPVDSTGIYLLNQYRYPNNSYFWQVPMGMIDKNSTPLKTAIKELKEETGITAQKLTEIGEVVAEPGMSNQKTIVFVAEELEFGQKVTEFNEIGMKLKKFTFDNLIISIKNNEITCGFTLSSILLLKNNYLI